MMSGGRGTLFLIVGPSGAGKDTLLDGATAALARDQRIVFARRAITRPPTPPGRSGEEHEPMAEADFEQACAAGAFAMHWTAHGGIRYGIRIGIEDDLAAGRDVVASVSRQVIERARARYRPLLRIVEITASPAVLAERLRRRGREDAAAIEERLARAAALAVEGDDVVRIDNSGEVEAGVRAFLAVLGRE
jgi:phosphonate metabolism protein PhnN/1,5-bisphosphokinase (PRPP-forming)